MLRETFYTRNQKYKKCSKNIYVVLLLIQIMSWCCIVVFSFLFRHFYSFIYSNVPRKKCIIFEKKSIFCLTVHSYNTTDYTYIAPRKSWKYNKVRRKIISNTRVKRPPGLDQSYLNNYQTKGPWKTSLRRRHNVV